MWKMSAYLLIAVIAIAIGPLMTYRLQDESHVNSQAIMIDHRSIGDEHKQLSKKIADLSIAVADLQVQLRSLQSQMDGLSENKRRYSEPNEESPQSRH